MFWLNYRALYLERLESRRLSPVYVANVAKALERFTHYAGLQERELETINQQDLDRFTARRVSDTYRNRPISSRTINNELRAINSALAKAGPRCAYGAARRNYGILSSIPPFAELLREEQRIPALVSPEQLARFIGAARLATVPRLAECSPVRFWSATLAAAAITALRRGALLRIPRPPADVLIERRILILPAAMNKTGQELELALGSEEFVRLLADLPTRPGEPLLPWRTMRGRPMGCGYFSRVFRELQTAAGIEDNARFRLKDLRSTAATETALRVNSTAARRKLGHSAHTHTLEANYLSGRVQPVDQETSETLARLVLPALAAPELRIAAAS